MNAKHDPITPLDDAVAHIAHAHGVSPDAARHLLDAIVAGGGRQAQFNHPEFRGPGQWMSGGMVMTSDLFDTAMNHRVDSLAQALATELAPRLIAESREAGGRPVGNAWWPEELGAPSTSGAQNQDRYAFFADKRRLVTLIDGHTTVYDTGDHAISGVAQSQGSGRSWTFTSQHGPVDLQSLQRLGEVPTGSRTPPSAAPAATPAAAIEGAAPKATAHAVPPQGGDAPHAAPASGHSGHPATGPAHAAAASVTAGAGGDPVAALEKLAAMLSQGLLTRAEFDAAKSRLLGRL